MRLAVIAEAIENLRRARGDLPALFLLAVEDAQRVLFKAGAAGLAQVVIIAPQVFLELFMVGRAAFRAADAVDVHRKALNAKPFEQVERQGDAFRVHARARRTVDLHAKLVMFAQAACLRLLIAEHRAVEIIHLRGLRLVEEFGFHEHARNARRALRLERHGTVALVREGVHLLLHHVRGIAHAAQEQLRMLEHGRARLAEAVNVAQLADDSFDVLPFVAFLWGHIPHPLGYLVLHVPSPRK